MYKVFLKYPESLRPAFPRLKEKLEDPDPGIWKNLPATAHGKRASSVIVTLSIIHQRMWDEGRPICDAAAAHLQTPPHTWERSLLCR